MLKRARNVSQTRLLGTEVRMNECQKKITIGVKKRWQFNLCRLPNVFKYKIGFNCKTLKQVLSRAVLPLGWLEHKDRGDD